ncbi:MAG: DEAD/DEAH box helicase [Proteobacteria bacterium]|nr:DEAD/DEAH box helicase [Pseudomonadota bacterium]
MGRKNKRYFKKPRTRNNHSFHAPKIRPGMDERLENVFDRIGVPQETEFVPDPFQLNALSAIEKGDCLVTAPTGSGKTWIAEQAIQKIIGNKGKVWYGTPLKALSNTIYASFATIFGQENIGILTGDKKENPDAPIVIGTTEILRNHLYDAMHRGEDLSTDFVILDEAHFLGDEERGVVWEEIMIYLPPRIPLLMLSATIGNAHQIAAWLKHIRGNPCIVIDETQRPVPLYPIFFHPSGKLMPLVAKQGKGKSAALYKKVLQFIDDNHQPSLGRPGSLPPMGDILNVLNRYRLLPAIFFLKSRADCDRAIELVTEEILLSDPERKEKLMGRIFELVEKNPHLSKHKQLWSLKHLAVGAHHSGQLPAWKVLIETLMTEGLLDALFATSTVAAGVNFPARTVVMFNSDRYNGTEFMPLTPTEFQQMTGRAGRRGKDNIGFAVTVPGKFMNLKVIPKLIHSPPLDVNSQIKINFSMALNLLLSHSPAQIKLLLEKSFASFQLAHHMEQHTIKSQFITNHNGLWEDFSRHFDFLKDEGFVDENGQLTPDGEWASKLRIDSPLLVAEGFRLNIFPDRDPAVLAAIIAAFVNERESDDELCEKNFTPKHLLSRYLKTKNMLRPFAHKMIDWGFDVKPLFLQPAVTMHAWAKGADWEKILLISDLAEGDMARLILRTADNLRHIKNLIDIFPDISNAASLAIDMIMKEPIVSFYDA